jgi:type I restriction enzyme S subunit
MEPVKKGFKKTEVGVIPEDWLCEKVEQVAKITTGDKDTQNRVPDGLYPFYVRSNIVERINSYSFDGEAVLTSGDGVGVGKIFHYLNGKFDYHQRVYNIYNYRENVSGKYFFYYFSNHFYKRVMSMTAKSSVDSVRREMIADMLIPLPPTLTEQKAIADALSDVEELIASLEKLIAKKKAIKQGAMQQLLTPPHKGGKRLDGFSGEWKEVKLGEIFKIIAGKSKSNFINGFGKYLIVDMGSVSIEGKLIALKRTDYSSDFLRQGNLVMPKDDIGGGFIIGRTAYIPENDKYILGDHVFKLEPYYGNSLFYSYLINSNTVNNQIKKKVSGSAQLGLGRKSVEMQILHIPYSNEEQNAIAEVLSDMDTEIQAIELNLHKTTLLKQGMMQELLTGKTRLV